MATQITTEWGTKVDIPEQDCQWEDLLDPNAKVYVERNRWIGERTNGVTMLDLSYLWATINGVRYQVHGVPFYSYCNGQRNGFKSWLYKQLKTYNNGKFLPGFFENVSVLM